MFGVVILPVQFGQGLFCFFHSIGKNMYGVVISPVQFGRGLFCYSNFNLFYIDDNEEANLIAISSRIFNYS